MFHTFDHNVCTHGTILDVTICTDSNEDKGKRP